MTPPGPVKRQTVTIHVPPIARAGLGRHQAACCCGEVLERRLQAAALLPLNTAAYRTAVSCAAAVIAKAPAEGACVPQHRWPRPLALAGLSSPAWPPPLLERRSNAPGVPQHGCPRPLPPTGLRFPARPPSSPAAGPYAHPWGALSAGPAMASSASLMQRHRRVGCFPVWSNPATCADSVAQSTAFKPHAC